jgi:hypothetical protein
LVFVAGLAWYATRVGLRPDYAGIWLPATLITGLGIGLTFPVLSAAAVSSLHPERFAVGSAVNQTARQVGGAFGVALLVVILGAPTRAATALASFHDLWWYCAGMAALAGVLCSLLAPPRPALAVPAASPAPLGSPVVRVGTDPVAAAKDKGFDQDLPAETAEDAWASPGPPSR